ncbi:MAG: AmmeMemoRadiSam system radical SAM enzyme [Acidobacteriota bacterium]
MSARLDALTQVRAELALPHRSGKLTCLACAHCCKLADGARGRCLVRRRRGAALAVPWGYTAGAAVDPIEKKPFFHFLPGARALSFGMLGCDLHCGYCQNWFTSQALRDPRASEQAQPVEPEELVAAACSRRCEVITSTYNEPLVSAEWAHDVFALARQAGLRTSFVSNGHATPDVLDYLAPLLDACKVDLKAYSEQTYASLGGKLGPVLATIAGLVERGIWCEVVTLVVPGLNDGEEELRAIATFLAGVSPDLPWHVTAFHPDYRLAEPPPTPGATLARAAELGRLAGLRHVYAGNLPGRLIGLEDTRCPACGATLVRRLGFTVLENRLAPGGRCLACGAVIAGLWSARQAMNAPQHPPRETAAGL